MIIEFYDITYRGRPRPESMQIGDAKGGDPGLYDLRAQLAYLRDNYQIDRTIRTLRDSGPVICMVY